MKTFFDGVKVASASSNIGWVGAGVTVDGALSAAGADSVVKTQAELQALLVLAVVALTFQ